MRRRVMKYIKEAIGEKRTCPGCGVDLVGDDIYEHLLDEYNGDVDRASEAASYYGGGKFMRYIGIEVQGGYDGISLYSCPDCKCYWRRFEWSIPLEGDRE